MDVKEKTPHASDGYIVYQGKLTNIRYGLRKSSANGCGWIAAYNFLKQQGGERNRETCSGGFNPLDAVPRVIWNRAVPSLGLSGPTRLPDGRYGNGEQKCRVAGDCESGL